MSDPISNEKACYFWSHRANDTDCNEEEIERIKELIDRSEEVLEEMGIKEQELIEYVYEKYIPEEEKVDEDYY